MNISVSLKSLEGMRFMKTPKLVYEEAVKYCKDQNADPFIPKNQGEYDQYLRMTFDPSGGPDSFYPMTDRAKEGTLVLEDGTDYKYADYKIEPWDTNNTNDDDKDCVNISKDEKAKYISCKSKLALICYVN
ncbi:UNVERIFIED_CONTAM: hypothetical protein RMT77_009279 [Armadillidium vulgare]